MTFENNETTVAQSPVEESVEMKDTEKAAVKTKKKKVKKHVPRAHVYIQATFNNTIINISDNQGAVLFQLSAGRSGFKGPKKATPYAASTAIRGAIDRFREFGITQVDIIVKGAGAGREAAIRAIHACGIQVISIKDKTPIPHNGPRPRKPRRV